MRYFPVFLVLFLFLLVKPIEGRTLPRFKTGGKATVGAARGFTVAARLRADRRAIIMSFNNLQKVNSVFYTLMYQTNGKDEGVSGTLTAASGNSATRELLFGTCSSGVCRYHQNLSQMKLEVVSELPSGKRSLKRFRIRI